MDCFFVEASHPLVFVAGAGRLNRNSAWTAIQKDLDSAEHRLFDWPFALFM
jgi:hypothetical protein